MGQRNTDAVNGPASPIPMELLQPDPVLPLPTRAQVVAAVQAGRLAELEQTLRNRAESIRLRAVDPLHYGFEPATYAEARALLADHDELLLMGGNREGKTDFAAKYCVETLVKREKTIVAMFHSQEKSSRLQQQPRIHSVFPPEWRGMASKAARAATKSGAYMAFKPGSGFTNDQFILPNGSMGLFFNYAQDVKVMEGYEFDLVWFDELVPLRFLEALTYRLSPNKRLVILITFTPVEGVTPVVMRYLGGARVVKTRPAAPLLPATQLLAKDCPEGHMPFVMRGARHRSAVLFFHNGMNPLGAGTEVRKKLVGASQDVIKMRAFGYPTKQVSGCFAKFGAAHIVTRARWEEISKGPGTRYVVADPRPGKNWFIKWYFATPQGWNIMYREWPDKRRFGEWALPPNDEAQGAAKFRWRPGPAQFVEAGRGIIGYKRLLLEAEGWRWSDEKGAWQPGADVERIARRLIDPRMGGTEIPSEERGTSLIALMEDEQKDVNGRLIGPRMEWEKGPGGDVGDGVEMLVDLMDYDERRPVDALNCPHWYVVEDCEQSILAYAEYTNAGGESDALKDIIDDDRYYAKGECRYLAPQAMRVRRGGFY